MRVQSGADSMGKWQGDLSLCIVLAIWRVPSSPCRGPQIRLFGRWVVWAGVYCARVPPELGGASSKVCVVSDMARVEGQALQHFIWARPETPKPRVCARLSNHRSPRNTAARRDILEPKP